MIIVSGPRKKLLVLKITRFVFKLSFSPSNFRRINVIVDVVKAELNKSLNNIGKTELFVFIHKILYIYVFNTIEYSYNIAINMKYDMDIWYFSPIVCDYMGTWYNLRTLYYWGHYIIAELSPGHSPSLESESRNSGLKMIHRTNQKLTFILTFISHKTSDMTNKKKNKICNWQELSMSNWFIIHIQYINIIIYWKIN